MVQKAISQKVTPLKLGNNQNATCAFRLVSVFKSLKLQFVLLVSVIVICCAFFAVWIDTRTELQKNHAQRMSQAETFSQLLARSTSTHLENFTVHDLSKLLEDMSSRPNVNYIAVTSTLVDLKLSYFKPSSEVRVNKLLADDPIEFVKSATFTNHAYHIAIPILVGDKRAGALYIGWQVESSWQLLPSILKRELLTTLPMFLIIILLIIFMIKRVIQPLDELKRASERIAEGDLDIEIQHSQFREISSLSRAFIKMAGQLNDSISRIRTLAYKDSLTGLSNRALFNRHLEAAHFQQQNTGAKFAVCFLDIDDFSRVNDTLGHDAGDYLLVEVANRLKKVICDLNRSENKPSPCDNREYTNSAAILSRFGGDEFTLLLHDIERASDVELIIEALICAMHEPIWVNDHSIVVTISIGVAICSKDGETLSDILRSADLAMYHAKRELGVSYRFFSECMDKKAQTRMVLEADLRKALKTNALSLVFQPKVDLKTRRVVGAEALVRWQHPDRGMVTPSEFIPIAEESRLIIELGLWVLKRSIMAAAHWYRLGFNIPIAVNVSAVQLENANFVEEVRASLSDVNLPPSMLELEVTETVALSDPDASAAQIAPLQEDGVRFAIDDFGTGYSNLSQLRRASFDVFKIDRSFTSTMCNEQDSKVIVETIIAMAKAMNYSTVAEGVESEEEAQMLYEAGCKIGQGYLFSKPLPLARLLNYFKNDLAKNKSVVALNTVKSKRAINKR